jgi:hypothetical protein
MVSELSWRMTELLRLHSNDTVGTSTPKDDESSATDHVKAENPKNAYRASLSILPHVIYTHVYWEGNAVHDTTWAAGLGKTARTALPKTV